ncbi:hypothetical protein [Paenibacillus methanolicus]|uniref:Uncharacterized protein n=1 Tax=Paenibacillus methanolicus TaxID=582686 RepID=A0A5S5BWX5_9BACL|nr:hypothetical protein [Paenibacillus methanolicus]TYP70692.1 hypothetical protein BCM02_111198 [Paenibacillus methanolicus]
MLTWGNGLNPLPLAGWISGLATGGVLLLALGLVGAMFAIIRITTSDSDKHREIRDFVETLFGTPAHLRPGSGAAEETAAGKEERPAPAANGHAYSEPCPGCGETVTQAHADCPSCGLRLQ